jgi:hypothetical protein
MASLNTGELTSGSGVRFSWLESMPESKNKNTKQIDYNQQNDQDIIFSLLVSSV